MAVLSIVVVLVTLSFVLPFFANSFAGLGVELPLPTRIVLSLGRHLYLAIIALGLVIWLVVRVALRMAGPASKKS